jgi:hypothetical protein
MDDELFLPKKCPNGLAKIKRLAVMTPMLAFSWWGVSTNSEGVKGESLVPQSKPESSRQMEFISHGRQFI